jgi:hypothetical protein
VDPDCREFRGTHPKVTLKRRSAAWLTDPAHDILWMLERVRAIDILPTIFAANLDRASRHEKLRPTLEIEFYKVCYVNQSHGCDPTAGGITQQDQGFNIYREPCSDSTLSDFANLTFDYLARIRPRLCISVHMSRVAAQLRRARCQIRPSNRCCEVRPARSTACCAHLHNGSAAGSRTECRPDDGAD